VHGKLDVGESAIVNVTDSGRANVFCDARGKCCSCPCERGSVTCNPRVTGAV